MLVVNRCHPSLIDDRFQLLIDAVLTVFIETLPDLVEIRLQGSVARGDAVLGQSDMDFMALVARVPDDGALDRLQDRASRLPSHSTVVSRIDLDVVAVPDLIPFQRFVLGSDSLSLYGVDTLTVREQWVDCAELARLVTPDTGALLVDYREFVEEARLDDETMRFCSRIVGKDVLKCLRGLMLVRGGEYEVAIDRISAQTRKVAPDLLPLAERLYGLYRTPVTDPEVVLEVLDEATATLLPAMHRALPPLHAPDGKPQAHS